MAVKQKHGWKAKEGNQKQTFSRTRTWKLLNGKPVENVTFKKELPEDKKFFFHIKLKNGSCFERDT